MQREPRRARCQTGSAPTSPTSDPSLAPTPHTVASRRRGIRTQRGDRSLEDTAELRFGDPLSVWDVKLLSYALGAMPPKIGSSSGTRSVSCAPPGLLFAGTGAPGRMEESRPSGE